MSDLVIITLYPSLILRFIKEHQFKSGCIITDATEVKSNFIGDVVS